MVAEVIINRNAKKLNKTFDYNIPEEIQEQIIIGSKVIVPFGKGEKLEEAFVIGIKEKSEYQIKDIIKLEDKLKPSQIELARWMAKRYFCNISDCIKLMLTPGTRSKQNKIQDKTINVVYLNKDIEEIEFDMQTMKIKSEKQKKILEFIKDNEGVTLSEIEMFTGCSKAIVQTLIKNDYLEIVEKKIERNPLVGKNIEKTENLKLNEEQEKAYKKVEESIINNKYETFLLYGVTGSRKNRNIFTINKKSNRRGKDGNSVSSRNLINATNVR